MSKLHGDTYKSKFHGWQTPQEFWKPLLWFLNLEYFTYDVCNTPTISEEGTISFNIPAAHYYTEKGMYSRYGELSDNIVKKVEDFIGDGLTGRWIGDIWMNPPHGALLEKFMDKLYLEYSQGYCRVWALLPVGDRTLNVYYQEIVFKQAGFVVFLKGKISFLKNGKKEGQAPSAYMLVYFGRDADEIADKWVKNPPLAGTLMRTYR